MSLRLRLAIGLAALLVVGLAAFGVATYSFYAPTEYSQLDSQLTASVGIVSLQLAARAHLTPSNSGQGPGAAQGQNANPVGGSGPSTGHPDNDGDHDGTAPAPPRVLQPGTYAALVSPAGKIVTDIDVEENTGTPDLSGQLHLDGGKARIFEVGSVRSGPEWRVLVAPAGSGFTGYLVVVATPTTQIESALHHLLLVEGEVALGLLLLLLAGAWLILRRGLSPLEHMAEDSRSIAAGDLSRRVGPSKGPTEVVELGAALNAMLADIEDAFRQRDVTEARLRQFLADASHELRTPLTSIQGFAELFRMSLGDPQASDEDAATIARRIEGESRRMKRLVDDLLLLAQLDQQPVLQPERVDLTILAADVCSAAVAADGNHPIHLDAPAPATVTGDRTHLEQAVTNLVTNAVKHTPPGTRIDVTVHVDPQPGGDARPAGAGTAGGAVTVAVRDHGPGLEEEALAHVFDRFWRADSARAGDGAGLGLAIVAAIAAEHGGAVTAANAPGEGAQFTLILPDTPPPGASGTPAESLPLRRDL